MSIPKSSATQTDIEWKLKKSLEQRYEGFKAPLLWWIIQKLFPVCLHQPKYE